MQGCPQVLLLLLWVLGYHSVPAGMRALMDGARPWLYWAKNLLPYKHADYLGGGLSSPHPLCCPAGSLKAAPRPVEKGCERHDQIPLFRCFSYF